MMKRYIQSALILGILLIGFGCSDRGTNVPVASDIQRWNEFPKADHVFDTLLALQIRNESQLMLGAMYIPKVAVPANGAQPVPSLVLLAPETGDKFYYFNHGLLDLMDEMIASGEIQPMVVHCVSNDQVFGGYWYGNSAPAGYYDGIIGAPGDSGLVSYVRNIVPATINSPAKRGIGGIGTASYGVFRALLKHPGTYTSVTVADGPLDFNGADNASGLIPLFKTAMNEQYANRRPKRDSLGIKFDSLAVSPLSMILLGGAFAFSPFDTLVSFSYTPARSGLNDSIVRITLNSTTSVTDTQTLVTGLVVGMKDYQSYDPCFPFYVDSSHAPNLPGDIYQPMWNLWLRNNLDSLYVQAGGTPLAGVNMYFSTSSGSPFNYYPMTQSWINYLKNQGLSAQITEQPYGGYSGAPDAPSAFVYDLLRKWLKFHSDNFGH